MSSAFVQTAGGEGQMLRLTIDTTYVRNVLTGMPKVACWISSTARIPASSGPTPPTAAHFSTATSSSNATPTGIAR